MHSNKQLAVPHEHFCTKLLSDYKEFNPEIFSFTTIFARSGLRELWCFRCTFSNIYKNFPSLGVRNALQSVELSIQVQFSRFLQVPPCYRYMVLPVQHTRTQK